MVFLFFLGGGGGGGAWVRMDLGNWEIVGLEFGCCVVLWGLDLFF